MKKLLVLLIVGLLVATAFCFDSAEAKKGGKSKGLAQEDLQKMSDDVNTLTQKMYAKGLFSPEDSQNLIGMKMKLDDQMLVSPDPSLAPLYFKLGILYKSREMKDESVDCFQTILENFADTALAPKAAAQLKSMGVVVAAPQKKDESGE